MDDRLDDLERTETRRADACRVTAWTWARRLHHRAAGRAFFLLQWAFGVEVGVLPGWAEVAG